MIEHVTLISGHHSVIKQSAMDPSRLKEMLGGKKRFSFVSTLLIRSMIMKTEVIRRSGIEERGNI